MSRVNNRVNNRGGSRPKNPGRIRDGSGTDLSRRSIFVPGHSGTVCTYNL